MTRDPLTPKNRPPRGSPLTKYEINGAFHFWQKPPAAVRADDKRRLNQSVGLRQAREATMISVTEMARRLGISTASYAELEANDDKGTIKLNSLRRAAKALNCELIYFFQPLDSPTFIERLWRPAIAIAKQDIGVRKAWTLMRTHVLGNMVTGTVYSRYFRRQLKMGKPPQIHRKRYKPRHIGKKVQGQTPSDPM